MLGHLCCACQCEHSVEKEKDGFRSRLNCTNIEFPIIILILQWRYFIPWLTSLWPFNEINSVCLIQNTCELEMKCLLNGWQLSNACLLSQFSVDFFSNSILFPVSVLADWKNSLFFHPAQWWRFFFACVHSEPPTVPDTQQMPSRFLLIQMFKCPPSSGKFS